MKKYILILLVVFSLFGLAACKETEVDNDTAVTAAFSDPEINQNSITIKLTVDDPNDEITGTIYARLYDNDDNAISSRSFTKGAGDHALDAITITFASLGLEENYYIEVDVTVERDTITVEEYTFQTIGTIHITTTEQFLAMDTYRGADYVLDNDLDFADVPFVSPFSSVYFSGTFDGQGYTLANIDIVTARSSVDVVNNYYYLGVFGYVSSSAEISNLVLNNVSIGTETEPQPVDNAARIGFLAGYVSSASVSINNITVENSHYYIEANTDNYIVAGGLVGELRGELNGATITNSSITLITTSPQHDNRYLVRMGGAVGFLQPDAELHEVNVDVDLTYETSITAFSNDEGLKVAVGGAIGDNNAINNTDSVTDIIAIGDVNITVDVALDETFESGAYALYVGGLVGYSSTKITDGFYGGSIHVEDVSPTDDDTLNKQIYIGALFGYYGVQKVNEQLVWVNQGEVIMVTTVLGVNLRLGTLIGDEPKTPAHIVGVTSVETVVLNDVGETVMATVIADMTAYFSSDYVNDSYDDFINSSD